MATVQTPPSVELSSPGLTRGKLPRYAPVVLLVLSFAAVGGLFAALGSFSVPLTVFLGIILYAVVILVVTTFVEGARAARDRLATTLMYSAFGLAVVPLVSLLWTVLENGLERFNGYFLTTTMRGVFGGMDAGGAYHAIMGTLEITAFATVISVPIGMLTAIYLVEYGPKSKLGRGITFFVDVMTGIPSIVAGLFAYALFVLFFGPGVRMGAAGSVALAVLMIPVVVRASEEMLKLVPNELREAAYALGVPKWLTIVKVVLRTAAAGLVTGVMLAIARVIGETAPLLIVAGVVDSANFDLFEGRMMTLPVFVYGQYTQGLAPPGPDSIITINYDRAWAAALTLILIVMVLNLIARIIARIFSPKTGR
ncbi:phosphate ABC transporter permease PstA [Actinophytocola algeriensis]|uniref:Phosphate transport system permease protein PstA n=1 Tax=Actinophytocola algeriensis TaxID=1768010 RepID=A0A7W7VDX5_9PSEU|nr:phosphate ABC transporter permease PstA [Actinophytocola algeriensis]MBB4906450.1 phosphate transport system permease protein [Actinophytocola algeriensis]MBE1477931.1 phosphate transport system permease protein [Actinophytocola algeriensis]